MKHDTRKTRVWVALAGVLWLAAVPAQAQVWAGKIDPDGLTLDKIKEQLPEYFAPRGDGLSPEALPDVFGPGAVLRVGNVYMKVTNWGHCGNLFTNVSTDPAGQWPGSSGVEYLSSIRLAVGAVNPRATDPNAVRRVSYLLEWRPRTLDPEDKIYRAYDGIVNGQRLFNDDGDVDLLHELNGQPEPLIDEDFLDGRDNDGDGKIDEDYGALGQEMYSCTMWDNTEQAINTTFNEKHVPLGIECRQTAWAYSIRGFQDFNVIQYEIYNRSGHLLDSLVIGWLVDVDAGPVRSDNFWTDDFDLPHYPYGEFPIRVGDAQGDLPDGRRRQYPHDPALDPLVPADSALCPRVTLRINGFSVADDNGDAGVTRGIPSFLLVNFSPLDPTPAGNAPRRVGWRAFRSYTSGTPYGQGGGPTVDQERFQFLTSTENVDQETGFISRDFIRGEVKGDYIGQCSVGPWRNVPDGGMVSATVAFAVTDGSYAAATNYEGDYDLFQGGTKTSGDLLSQYKSLETAFTVQIAYEGVHERREGLAVTDRHGAETGIRFPRGTPQAEVTEECTGREPRTTFVTDREYTWFDFDCDFCTGVWDYAVGAGDPKLGGLYHHTWNAEAPPPNPNLNVSPAYNFSANPERRVVPTADREIVLAWDNLSEVTPDPKSQWFDFRAYRVWKVSDWTRPVGSPGPAESDWRLLGEFRLFDYEIEGVPLERNYSVDPEGARHCPEVYVPNFVYFDSLAGSYKQGKIIPICLDRGDLWDKQSGRIIKPDTSFHCVPVPGYPDSCEGAVGCILHHRPCSDPENQAFRPRYAIGRYRYRDTEVKNGFTYFYSVTASDSVYDLSVTTELSSRRSGVEAEGVAPQAGVRRGAKQVWVVPNPYRGKALLSERPSAWDLTPNAADPTGTHIDFMGLPPGPWTIRIFTVSGDLVAKIDSYGAVNESLRPPVRQETPSGPVLLPGYNQQQDNPNDGQASWNLISRNGQDIVSGIYLFTVESSEGTQRGKFIVIR